MERNKLPNDRPIVRNGRFYYVFVCNICLGKGTLVMTSTFCGTCTGCGGLTEIVRRPNPWGSEWIIDKGGIKSCRLTDINYY